MPTPSTTDPRHAAARRHLQDGAPKAALPILEALLEDTPDNPDLLNDAALAYAQDGNTAQAERCLRRALEVQPDHETAFYNLLDLLIKARKDVDAREVFASHANQLPDSDDKTRYRKRLGDPLPAHQGDGAPARSHDTDTLRVAFVCGPDRKFITDIEREIGKRHEVRTAYFDDKVNLDQIQRVMDWADVTWFEWCDKILAHASHKLRKTSRVVCRLHRYEAFTNVPGKVSWSFIDRLVLVSDPMREALANHQPSVLDKVETSVIPNGVDLAHFPFRERHPGFNLAYVGYLHHRKNPSLLLQCLNAIVEKDERYHLHIAGYFQQPDWKMYFNHMLDALNLQDHVTMHGWVEDISSWLDDKNYLVSTSVHESFGYGIAEAMARGIKPIIHHFNGADALFPEDLLFHTVDDFVDAVQDPAYDSAQYHDHIAKHFSLEGQLQKCEQLFDRLAEKASQTHSPPQVGKRSYYDLPGRNLIVTGIPRSGTSLASVLLNSIENVVCLNEILYNVEKLPHLFSEVRRRLVNGEPIPNKFDNDGNLTTNTLDSEHVQEVIVEGTSKDVVVGSKVNVPYLLRLPTVLSHNYRTIAIVRHPAYAIGSWRSKKSKALRVAQVSDDNMNLAWNEITFKSDHEIARMAELWNLLASIIWRKRDQITILRYEDLVRDPLSTLAPLGHWFDLASPVIDRELNNMNRDKRYKGIDEIKECVQSYAPIRSNFGYE